MDKSKKTLSPRESDVLNELLRGLTEKEIAHNLCISVNTVHGHIKSIYIKLEVSNRAQLMLVGLQMRSDSQKSAGAFTAHL